jgi:hypothetical protein
VNYFLSSEASLVGVHELFQKFPVLKSCELSGLTVTRSTILLASAIAATGAGLFGGTVDNFLAASIAATIAITPCLRFGSTG